MYKCDTGRKEKSGDVISQVTEEEVEEGCCTLFVAFYLQSSEDVSVFSRKNCVRLCEQSQLTENQQTSMWEKNAR